MRLKAFFSILRQSKNVEDLELEEKNFMPIWDNKVEVIKKKSTPKISFCF